MHNFAIVAIAGKRMFTIVPKKQAPPPLKRFNNLCQYLMTKSGN